jgi:glucose-6-phosphate 1-dehydrogenase
MEPPASFRADAIRNEKVKLLGAIQPVELSDTVAAQYKGYRQAKGVAPDSRTPTYAAAKLYIANWRWDGVPFYIQSGKALDTKQTQIAIQFKAPPHLMFPLPPGSQLTANVLAMCVQPDEGIHLRFEAKVPDTEDAMRSVLMDFHYADSFGGSAIPDAYQRLLLDAIQGDQALFTRADGIDTTWRLVDPIISGWQSADAAELEMYAPGSARPACADELLERDGRHWLPACVSHE